MSDLNRCRCLNWRPGYCCLKDGPTLTVTDDEKLEPQWADIYADLPQITKRRLTFLDFLAIADRITIALKNPS